MFLGTYTPEVGSVLQGAGFPKKEIESFVTGIMEKQEQEEYEKKRRELLVRKGMEWTDG